MNKALSDVAGLIFDGAGALFDMLCSMGSI